MLTKALGRCAKRHTQVVEYDNAVLPAVVCKTCGDALTEWAIKRPGKESA